MEDNFYGSLSRSNYIAEVDPANCVACGGCVEVCPQNAVKLGTKLCQKSPAEIRKTEIPDNKLYFGSEHWQTDFLTNRKNVIPETGTAPCKTNCPAHIAVQGYLKKAGEGKYREALELIKKENPFPAVCGDVCARFCEQVCTRGDIDQPVAIDEVKKFVARQELKEENRYIPEKLFSYGHKIAVIGSGPAGLSCAYYLAVLGHTVTVFEKDRKPGGMMVNGIPSFRLEKDVVGAEIDVLRKLGVEIRCGIEVGKDVTIPELREQGYKGFYIAIGAQKSSGLHIPGEELNGVQGGIDFLRKVNQGEDAGIGKKVTVIGGGNVAMDVCRTAVRLGAEEVSVVYRRTADEMPADKEEVEEAMHEGVVFRYLNAPMEVLGSDGKVCGLKVERMKLGEPDEKGRFVHEGHSLTLGRVRRDNYKYIDKSNVLIPLSGYDSAKRNKHHVDESKAKTFRDERLPFTEEQVKAEASRCLKCGAAWVDSNICIGCGLCTTRCKFDAIHLHKEYDAWGVPYEKLVGHVLATTAQRVGRRLAKKDI